MDSKPSLICDSKPIGPRNQVSICPRTIDILSYRFSISTRFSLSSKKRSVSPYARIVAKPDKDSEKCEYTDERRIASLKALGLSPQIQYHIFTKSLQCGMSSFV